MTQRERLLSVFRGVKPDRPAWLSDISYWYDAMKQKGELDSKYDGFEGYIQLHRDLGVCCYYCYGGKLFGSRFDGVEHETKVENGKRFRYWKTPKGELQDHWEYIENSYCWAHVEYAVKSLQDLEILTDIFQRTHYTRIDGVFKETSDIIGDDGVPLVSAPRSPLPALLTDWCGVENTILMLMDYPDTVEATLASIDKSNDPAFEIITQSPAELFHFCDNLDSQASTPFYKPYMKDYYEKRLAQLHRSAKFAAVHLDGFVKGLLPKLADSGFDAVESLTPKPVGDVAVGECRELIGENKTVLWGGIPGAMFCNSWQKQDIIAQTRHVLNAWDSDTGFVVGSADQIPPDGNIDFCRIIAETIESF